MSARARVHRYVVLYAALAGAFVLAGGADDSLLCDDAFYYFQIARHAAAGAGLSFDGGAPTNGFHPLWAWICVPIWRVFGGDAWRAIHVALLVLVAATAATAAVVFHLGRALHPTSDASNAGDRLGERATICFLLSPFTLLVPLRGCEAALCALSLALATWAAAALARRPSALAAAWLGLATGAAGLARTDNVLFGAAMLVFVVGCTRAVRPTLLFAAAAAATVAPWLAWSWLRCGTIVQVSGAAKRAIDLYGRMPEPRDALGAARNLGHTLVIATGWIAGEEWRPKRYTAVLLAAFAVQLAVAAWSAGRARRTPRVLWPLYAYCALHLGIYAWFYRAYYTWYVLPLVLAAALFVAERVTSTRAWRAVLLLAVVADALALGHFGARGPFRRHGAEVAQAALLDELTRLPPGSRVGLQNAGAVGYFAGYARPDVTVVNLDCVVNNAAFAAFRRDQYGEYLLGHVDWIETPPDGRFLRSEAAAAEFAAAHLGSAPGRRLLQILR